MKKKSFLTLSSLALAFQAFNAYAITINVEEGSYGDKVRISQTTPTQSIQSTRISPNALLVQVQNFTPDTSVSTVNGGEIVNGVEANSMGYVINIASPNFGFIQSTGRNGETTIEIYPDNLGARWKPSSRSEALYNDVQVANERAAISQQNQGNTTNQTAQSASPSNSQENQAISTQNQNVPSQNQELNRLENQIAANVNQNIIEQTDAMNNAAMSNTNDKANPIEAPISNQIATANRESDNSIASNIQNSAKQIEANVGNAILNETTAPRETTASQSNNQAPNTKPSLEQIAESSQTHNPNGGSFSFSLSDQGINQAAPIATDNKEAQQKQQEVIQTIEEQKNEEGTAEVAETSETAPQDSQTVGEIIYMDEEGNVVPAPLNIPQTIEEMDLAFADSDYKVALDKANLLKEKPLPAELTEHVFYTRLISLFALNKDTLEKEGPVIIDAASELLHANPNHEKKPEILEILILASLALNRTSEAQAYTDLLLEGFPNSSQTPSSMILLGNYFLNKGEYALASKYLEIVINNYPEDKFAKNAAALQTEALYKQGDYERTKTFIEFIDRRWPRFYLEDSDYFPIRGDVEERMEDYPAAIKTYMHMYNINPKGEKADFALDKLATLYYMTGDDKAAQDILDKLIENFPESSYRPRALLMRAENGLAESDLTLNEIFDLYERPNPVLPSVYYKKLVSEHPETKEAVSAELRMAAQALWVKDYREAADLARDFYVKHISTKEADIAMQILRQAVSPLMELSLSEKNYEQSLRLWEDYPQIHPYYTPIPSDLRMSLGRGLLNRRQVEQAEAMLEPFLEQIPSSEEDKENGVYAYNIMLAHALSNQDWNKVLDLTSRVEDWDLPKETGLQRLYTIALAAENLGLSARSLPIWQALAPNDEVPLYQRAYAQYFLARDAERRQNLRESYQANLDALAMFEDLKNQQSPYADDERIRESIAALMDITEIAGRYAESLQWLNNYRAFVAPTSEDYAGVQLREARIYKKLGDNERWRSILQQIVSKEPESVFGKMAQSELKAFEIARDLDRFTEQN